MNIYFDFQFRPDELQHSGVDPSKDDIITPCISQDERNRFESEFQSYLQRIPPEGQQECVGIKCKLAYLWELTELIASYHDKTPEGVMSFECLCGMIMNILPSHEDFQGALRDAGAHGHAGAVTLQHSRDIWRVLNGGKESLDAILVRRCRTCQQRGHIARYCWMKSTNQSRSSWLAHTNPKQESQSG